MLPYIFERPVIFQSRMVSFLPLAIGARIQLVPVVFRVERGKEYGRHCLGCKFFACTSIEATLLRRGYIVSVSFPLSASSVCAPSSRFCVQPCRTSSLDKCTYLLGYWFANTFAVKAAHGGWKFRSGRQFFCEAFEFLKRRLPRILLCHWRARITWYLLVELTRGKN